MFALFFFFFFFFFNDTATTEIYTLSLHDALPISGPLLEQYDPYCRHRDEQVEEEARVLHVVQVVGELMTRIFDRGAVVKVDLRPAGNPRLYPMTVAVEGDVRRELFDKEGALGPRAN